MEPDAPKLRKHGQTDSKMRLENAHAVRVWRTKVDALKCLQAETAVNNTGQATVNNTGQAVAELDALLPAILPSSPGFRLHSITARQVDAACNRALKREL